MKKLVQLGEIEVDFLRLCSEFMCKEASQLKEFVKKGLT